MEDLHLLRPWWLLGLVPILALCLLWARRRARGSRWDVAIAPELLAVLLDRASGRLGQGRVWLVAGALALATLGLAGPTWERLPQPVSQRTDATIIIWDLSLSMFAQDIAPARLVRARQKITDILRLRDEGVTALIVYAGDAHVVAPLTDDTRTIANLLGALGPDMMPILGSKPDAALALAEELFANAGYQQGRIVLITDGVDRPSDVIAYSKPNFPISILGVGTAAGSTIPLDFANQPRQVLTDDAGTTIIVRLEADRLRQIASASHGRYQTLGLQDSDIESLLATPLPATEAVAEVERQFDAWADMGYWACVLLLPLALLGFRRGVLVCCCMALLPGYVHAGWWDDLWQRRDQQGFSALAEGQPQSAASLFTDPQWRASARYRSEDFAGAAQDFGGDGSATGSYNLGNALAKQGDLQRAIAAYDAALAQQPDHLDAKFNKALVEKLLDDRQAQQPNQSQRNQPQPEQNENDAQGGHGDEPEPPEQAPEEAPGEQQPEPSESAGESEAQPGDTSDQDQLADSRDAQQDALEQWLRRVPDDPGGLLRRKFRYETNQRLRRGDYRQRRGGQIW